MVFVLGMLTLLALVGLVMITRTHGEARRVNLDASSQTARSAMSSVVRSVQDRLWRDIWGPSPDTFNPPRPLDSNRPAAAPMVLENNEAFDAPGENDRWLSSTIPYLLYETDPAAVLPPVYGEPKALPTYIGVTPPPGYPLTEDHVLSWRYVSYIGSDLLTNDFLQGGVQPFAWAENSRIEAPTPVQYSTANLENVNIMQTPPPASYGLAMIPGSTTNVTIAEARDNWFVPAHQAALAASPLFTNKLPQFPYFDTNADGAVDLYDADGDGVPDSPLSMVIPIDTEGANNPRQLYAAVRVVDHGGMLNVNTASSLAAPSGGNTFDEGLADLQRRGRRATEILLDEVVHPDDALGRTTEMMSYRSDGALAPDPIEYDADVVRRELIGGTPSTSVAYHPYGISEEASLRHRNMLVPYGRKSEWEEVVNGGGDEYVNIDRALMGSMQWTRQMNGLNETSYMRNAVSNVPRWNRFNASWGAADYEGVPSGGTNKGWRTMIDEHHRYFVRRPLLTTVSHFIEPPPVLTAPAIPSIDTRIVQLRALGMDWPVLDTVRFGTGPAVPTLSAAYENLPDVPEWARPQHIDLNMGSVGNGGAAKEDFIRYSAAAMYLALEGVSEYQGQSLADDRNRQWLAWQFAVNLADYRDADNEPTIVNITPSFGPPFRVFGIEKQPFLTEAYAFVTAGNSSSGPVPVSGPGDKWFFAFELFVPPLWNIPLNSPDNLYIRVQPSIPGLGLLPLSSFRNAGNFPPVLSADGDGDFFVLCGSKADAPSSLTPLVLATFFSNPQFKIPVNGQGTIQLVYSATGIDNDPADTAFHVLDTISPENSGDIAANTLSDFVNLSNDITSVWARRDPGWAVGTKREFSLLRSTKGWRFTTALQRYSEGQPPPLPQSRPPWLRPSLGKQNTIQDSLDKIVPQNIWPARARMTDMGLAGIDPRDSFNDPQPYHDFDSVGDLSRMLMIGAFNRTLNTDPPLLSDRDGAAMIGKRSVPELLTETLARAQTTDLVGDGLIRIAAGHVDFKDAIKVGGLPWTAKLADYFTTSSALFDQIDNDGDDDGTGTNVDLGDPTEGSSLLYRTAGKININTAPVSVLRSVPFMSLMPGSVEYISAGLSSGSPVNDFATLAPNGAFWDLASAIVSRREVRRVPVFEWDPVSLRMRIVAVAGRPAAAARPTPTDSGPFGHLFELPNMLLVTDRGGAAGDALFHIDRYALTPAPILDSHKVRVSDPSAGPSDIFSPDFRFKRADDDNDGVFSAPEGYYLDYIPVVPTGLPAPAPENPGLRARDIFLSRLANMLTVRSDVFTVYIALIDENGQYVRRSQLTLDRSECFRRPPVAGTSQPPTLPNILTRSDGSYAEDVR